MPPLSSPRSNYPPCAPREHLRRQTPHSGSQGDPCLPACRRTGLGPHRPCRGARDQRQPAVARWCVHRAWEHAGLVHSPWFRQRLVEMDAGHPAHPAFIASSAAHDRSAPTHKFPSPSCPGYRQALSTSSSTRRCWRMRGACMPTRPLESAIEAFRHTTQTYEMKYPALIALARSDFFGDDTSNIDSPTDDLLSRSRFCRSYARAVHCPQHPRGARCHRIGLLVRSTAYLR